jgi:hypothetical protein
VTQQAFEQLKAAMISQPILQHFDPDRPLTLETDASDYAIGAVCSQPDASNVLHPLAYLSRKLKDAELNYDVHDKELLAILEALDKWSTYCKSTKHSIQILSDHKNLEYWQTKKDLNLCQARWAEQLANYDFRMIYRPGKLAGETRHIITRVRGLSLGGGDEASTKSKSNPPSRRSVPHKRDPTDQTHPGHLPHHRNSK